MVSISSASLLSSSNVSKNNASLAATAARLASGKRLSAASEDIAALAAGTALATQVSSLRTSLGNVSQASSLLQVANGGLNQQLEILQRQKAIATQASSGQLNDAGRAALNQEFQGLSQELDRIAGNTSFNGVALLNGSPNTSLDFATGDATPLNVTLNSTTTASLFAGQPVDVTSQATAQAAAASIDAAITAITSAQANVGAAQSQFNASGENLISAIQSQEDARSNLLDTDVAKESTSFAAQKLLQEASIATQAQTKKLNQGLLKLLQ